MDFSSSYVDLISGQRRGLAAAAARAGLLGLSLAYQGALRLRNHWYDRLAMPRWLEVPVISIGNLTVGGTGKTPMAVWVCHRLIEHGLKPAVLCRGYKASPQGFADEAVMMSRQCPQAIVIAHPDRFAAGQLAITEYGATAAILDDGLQHRRMSRDLEIVLIDATRPFGFGHVLPRGLLREPLAGLARAHVLVITRSDQVTPDQLTTIEQTLRRRARADVPILQAVHRPAGFVDLSGQETHPGQHQRIGCLAGIARPETFVRTLGNLNIHPVANQFVPDHYPYQSTDAKTLERWVQEEQLDAIVTTEKDAVKLRRLDSRWPAPVLALRIEMVMAKDDDQVLRELIKTTLAEAESASPGGEPGKHAPS
ncbi:MAG TPA: tetraacyldisaccharide 4'-kinase [Phycisphaerae bacterium]|nr:tetraacyldisaccharide 4'-kinase [Phycisphaerae bacterium]HRY69167.1 tetraacyldisaccharide 4'-kinase [Phycisphaerae bacterium]HSA26128.1 tetraacyldisaccharide 4'-kinase [Phycisphaerae bacterium]